MLFERFQSRSNVASPCSLLFFIEVRFFDGSFKLINFSHTREFIGIFKSRTHFIEMSIHALSDRRICNMNRPFLRLRIYLCQECSLFFTKCSDCFLTKSHGFQHILFADFMCSCFNHRNIISRTCNS